MFPLWLSMGYRAVTSPPSPSLHLLRCRFYVIFITLIMVLIVLIIPGNVSRQDYHLLKEKSARLGCSDFVSQSVTTVTTNCQAVTINGPSLGCCFI